VNNLYSLKLSVLSPSFLLFTKNLLIFLLISIL